MAKGKPLADSIVVGARLSPEEVRFLDRLASKVKTTRSELAAYLLKVALKKPGLGKELVRLEQEKKERLIRYIM